MKLYNGKYNLEFNERSHRYKVNGEYKTGVTTILSILGKDGLIQWAANMAVAAMQAGAPPEEARKAHIRKRDKSADTGTRVHKWIEKHLQGVATSVSEDMKPSVEAFLKWEQENNIHYLHSEKVLYSEKYDYCGTADVMFELNGKTYMADFKTSDTDKEWKKFYTGRVRARNEHLLQCALYDQAYTEEYGKGFDAYMVIYLTKDGRLHTFEATNTEQLKEAAISVVRTYQLTKQVDFKNEWKEV